MGVKLRRIGGPAYRKSEKCEVCKRSFKDVPFGHRFRTSWGSIDVCEPCAEDLYKTVITDVTISIFSLKRDVEKIKNSLKKRAK